MGAGVGGATSRSSLILLAAGTSSSHVVVSRDEDMAAASSLGEWFSREQGRSTLPFMAKSPKVSPIVSCCPRPPYSVWEERFPVSAPGGWNH